MIAVAPPAYLQNPDPHDLVLPQGWKVDYRSHTSQILGTKGEVIYFGTYGGHTKDAEVIHQSDPNAFYFKAIIHGRPIEAAIAKDGTMAVCFQTVSPANHSSFAAFGYWTKVRSAEQTARVLDVILTRLYSWSLNSNLKPYDPVEAPANPIGDRFIGKIQVPEAYVYRAGIDGADNLGGVFRKSGMPTLEIRWRLPESKKLNPTAPLKWFTSQKFRSQEFQVWSKNGRSVSAMFVSRGDNPFGIYEPIVTCNENSPRAVVTAVLTRLSYQGTEG